MNQPQEIIVYRNPAEKIVWDALTSGPGVFYFVVFVVALGFGMFISQRFFQRTAIRLVGWQNEGWVHAAVGLIAGVLALWYVYI